MGEANAAVVKGAGKGKGPPIPANNEAREPQPKGKGCGKNSVGAGLSKFLPKKVTFGLLASSVLQKQRPDGHWDPGDLADVLHMAFKKDCIAEIPDFKARLAEHHPAVATSLVLQCLGDNGAGGRHVEATVQAVGAGRGGEATREEFSVSHTEEDRERYRDIWLKYLVSLGPPLGDSFLEVAQEWLAKQEGLPADLDDTVMRLQREWFVTEAAKEVKSISKEERQRREEEARQRSESQRLKEAAREKFWRELASRSIEEVPWEALVRWRWCSGGMGGAVLAQIGEDGDVPGGCVVIKNLGLNGVAEVMAAELSVLVGVRCARCRCVAQEDDEVKRIATALLEKPGEGSTIDHVLKKQSVASYLCIMEFVPGSVVQGVQGNQLLLSEAAPSILTQMGALVALDCLLNNVDRVPAIWLNDGNLSNVMVTGTTVVGIDQQVNPIGDEGGRARYLALLREFCDDSVHRRVASPASKRIRTALLENTGVEFNDENFGALLDGAGAAFRKLAAEKEVLLQAIKGLEHSMYRTFGASSTDVGLGRVELMTAFITECLECATAHV